MSRILFVAVLLAVMGGCAQKRSDYVLPPPPTEDQRAGFGTVGLTSVRFTPEISFRLPAKGSVEGAQRGAALGAAVPIAVGLQVAPIPYVFLAGVVLAPVGAVFGTVVGATEALPAEQVEKAEAVLKGALSPRHNRHPAGRAGAAVFVARGLRLRPRNGPRCWCFSQCPRGSTAHFKTAQWRGTVSGHDCQ